MVRRLLHIAVIALMWLIPVPVSAILLPSSTPTLSPVHANRNLIETGDRLIYAYYTIPYTVTPTVAIDETFIFRFLGTDGVTELGSVLAYPYNDSGYGSGVIAFYFNAADALTWGAAYTIRLSGNPGQFTVPPTYDFPVPASAWTSLTTQADNQDDVANKILAMALDLEVAWSATLTDQTEVGTVLSTTGESYFRNAIPGLQSMAPDLFYLKIENPTYTNRTWGTNQATTYANRFDGTWVGDGIDAVAGMFKLEFSYIGGAFILIACVFALIASVKLTESPNAGLVNSMLIMIVGVLLGWVPWAIASIVTIMCAMYVIYWFAFNRV